MSRAESLTGTNTLARSCVWGPGWTPESHGPHQVHPRLLYTSPEHLRHPDYPVLFGNYYWGQPVTILTSIVVRDSRWTFLFQIQSENCSPCRWGEWQINLMRKIQVIQIFIISIQCLYYWHDCVSSAHVWEQQVYRCLPQSSLSPHTTLASLLVSVSPHTVPLSLTSADHPVIWSVCRNVEWWTIENSLHDISDIK